jgi:hypothetical protein
MVTNEYPRFIRELMNGNPVYIYTLEGEYIHAVKLTNWCSSSDLCTGIIDVEDNEGDWHSIPLVNVTDALAVK